MVKNKQMNIDQSGLVGLDPHTLHTAVGGHFYTHALLLHYHPFFILTLLCIVALFIDGM